MISDITLGQFFPGRSILHRMNPSIKILLSIAFIVGIFMCDHILTLCMMLTFAIILIIVSRISPRTILRSIRPIIFIMLLTAILNILIVDGNEGESVLWECGIIQIYWSGIWRAIGLSIRIILLILVGSLFLTYTTSPIALTDAIETLLTPLRWIRVPVHEFAMMMSIALRFIPTLLEETEKIMNAQKSRGADLSSGNIFKRAKALIPVIVPLFVSAFQRAMDLATAMECRCYRGGKGRTKMRSYRIGVWDALMVLLHGALITAIVFGDWHVAVFDWGKIA